MPPKDTPQGFISQLREIVENKGSEQPASTIVRDLDTAALISKFIEGRADVGYKITDENSDHSFIGSGIDQISRNIMFRIDDNENVFKLFPDIELAAQIIVSSILSPKDMVNFELIFKTSENVFPPQMTTKMLDIIRKALENEYEFKKETPAILRKALFETGSCVKAILPESAVDQLINQGRKITTESIVSSNIFADTSMTKLSPTGILGNATKKASKKNIFATESITDTTNYDGRLNVDKDASKDDKFFTQQFYSKLSDHIEVTDNVSALRLPALSNEIAKQRLTELTSPPLAKAAMKFATETINGPVKLYNAEADKKITSAQLKQMVYKTAKSDYKPFSMVPSKLGLTRKSVGRPLILEIPSEAAIPVHVPGRPSEHVGYFVPIDADGNPVTASSYMGSNEQNMASLLQGDRTNNAVAGLMTDRARKNLSSDDSVPMIERMSTIYADLIEKDLLDRLTNGIYGKRFEIARSNEIYRIMLARTLQSQLTRLVYIPAEYITYFAFNYHRNGVGKSYLDDLANITSLRAMVMFSDVMAKLKSSIEIRNVNVTLDSRDPDPLKTAEIAKHIVTRFDQKRFPHGMNRVADLTDWIQGAGLRLNFSGHPRLPQTKFEYETTNTQHPTPDDSLDERFRHMTYMHFGLSPETVDNASRADFATTVEHQSVLFSQRITLLSNKLSEMLTEYSKKIILNDQSIIDNLVAVLNEHQGELEKMLSDEEKEYLGRDAAGFTSYLLQSFTDILVVDLPKPETTKNESLKSAFETYEQMIDAALKYIFDPEMMPAEFMGKSSEYVDAVRKVWKAYLMRDWMASNNYVPEAFEIANMDKDGKPMVNLLDSNKGYSEAIMLSVTSFLEKMKGARMAAEKDIENNTAGASDSSSYDSGSSDDDTDSGDDSDVDPGADNPFDSPTATGEKEGGENEASPDDPTGFDDIPGL